MSGRWVAPPGWRWADWMLDHGIFSKRSACTDSSCTSCPKVGFVWAGRPPVAPDKREIGLDLADLVEVIRASSNAPKRTGRFGERASDYRTQKARGVNAIKRDAFPNLMRRRGIVGQFPNTLFTLPHDGMDLTRTLFAGSYKRGYFARPCPTTPRHGFVESRQVFSQRELEEVITQTLREDEHGEVLVMPILTGLMSAVAHNAGITWAWGHDGVTGGTNVPMVIPCPVPHEVWRDIRTQYISEGGWYDVFNQDFAEAVPYIELVEHNQEVVPVQVRAGPPQEATKNYIPKNFTVKKVLKPSLYSGDVKALLGWESKVAMALEANGGPDGLVVWSYGLPLASHWAIHAIQAEIPVITDQQGQPQIGDRFEAASAAVAPLGPEDYALMVDFIKDAQSFALGAYDAKQVILTAMASSHAISFWDNAKHLLKLRALAVEMIARFVGAAAIGEDRHFYSCGPGRPESDRPDPGDWERGRRSTGYQDALEYWKNQSEDRPTSHLPWERVFGRGQRRSELDRQSVYYRMLSPMPINERVELLKLAVKDFKRRGWGTDHVSGEGDVGCSYGGAKWAQVAQCAVDLDEATIAFTEKPTRASWSKLVSKMNMACHVAHNGGGVLTKWIKQETLNEIANAPTWGFMNYFAGMFVLNGFRHPRYTSKGEE